MKFQNAFKLLLAFEGTAFTDISGDAGGKTKYGISQNAYPELNIAALSEEQAEAIYEKDFWEKCNCSALPGTLQYIVFDTAVNCGQGTAVLLLQKCAGLKPDGIMGPETIHAARQVTVAQYAAARKAHYNEIVERNPSQQKFITGWLTRVDKILQLTINN